MKHFIYATALAVTCAGPLAAETLTNYYSGFYVFGDSLSDDGKLGLPEPFFEGQFSSGPVWSEIIGERFTDAGLQYTNLALGGATAGDANIYSNGINDPANSEPEYPTAALPFATFNSQIDTFTAFLGGLTPGDNPLISVLLGANDIFQGGNPIDAANAVADGIQRLAGLAPIFDDFLVSTLPELGDAPASPGSLTIAGTFNQTLSLRLKGIADAGINIIDVNQNAFQAQLDPLALGVVNFLEPCLGSPSTLRPYGDCTIIGFEADGTPIRDLSIADTFYRIDDVHPSGPIQQAFGEFALAALNDSLPAAVPLPATLPLALFGLAGLGIMGARRRQRG